MKNTILILALLMFSSLAFAQENRGVSWILQMCSEKADCDTLMSAYQGASKINAGWMYLTSNPNRCKCAPTLLADPRPKKVRIDICNSTCFPERGRHCESQECFAGMSTAQASNALLNNDAKTFARIDKAISMARNDISKATGPLELGVKSCLECSLDPKARTKLNSYVQGKFSDIPNTQFVDNPINDHCTPGMLCERHGSPVGNSTLVADNDGLDYDTVDQRQYWNQNRPSWMVLAWKICNNGLKKDEGYKPGVDRVNYCGASREARDFNSATVANALDISSPVNPVDKAGCKSFQKAPDGAKTGFILKLGDGRNYAVWLAPAQFSKNTFKRVELRKDGKVVDRSAPQVGFRYGVPYEHDSNPRRRVYDFRRHPNTYPDNSVLFADGVCWVLEKPRFRVD